MTVSRALYRSSDLINDPSFFRFLRHPRLLLMLLYFLSFSFFFLFFFVVLRYRDFSFGSCDVSISISGFRSTIPTTEIPIIKNRIAFSRPENPNVSRPRWFDANSLGINKQIKRNAIEIQIYTMHAEMHAFEFLHIRYEKKKNRIVH